MLCDLADWLEHGADNAKVCEFNLYRGQSLKSWT